MREEVVRRQIPAEQSILWKPLYDSHYVVASLQIGDGGRRKIFIRQQALARVGGLVGAFGRRAVGLCLGHLYQCPATGADYLVIESLIERQPVNDESEIVVAVAEALADRSAAIAEASLARPDEHYGLVLGWYRGVPNVEAKPTGKTAEAHTSLFHHAWQTALVVGESSSGSAGAFFLNDTLNSRWFYAPFYELPDHPPLPHQPKSSVIGWPQYMTADTGLVSMHESARAMKRTFADVLAASREAPSTKRADQSTEKLSIVDDRDQRTLAPPSRRRVTDADDTVFGDDPGRYIELARTEGFFIACRFDTVSDSSRPEALWILNEPYSGMLLAVVATPSEVVDATLHYNLQTDDVGLSKTPSPEHRDVETKTIYVRETCADSLRARCRRLRATNALVREWKVTPRISFLTPGEWESLPSDGGINRRVDMIGDLNNARIAELPEGVRNQFHLVAGHEARA